jgi:hypothetical protein
MPLDSGDLETSGLFGVGVQAVHHFVRSPRASPVPRAADRTLNLETGDFLNQA